jgi:SAM-dependent methyltransferase
MEELNAGAGGYNPVHFESLAAAEDRHFWFRTRNRIISGLAAEVVNKHKGPCRVVEIGCGNGNVLRHLAAACPHALVIGLDLFDQGLRLARRRCPCPLVQADVKRPPFQLGFHLAAACDVIEHVADDDSVFRSIHAMLEDGGAVLITAPARRSLWSYFDEASNHCRRYELPELRSKLTAAGFRIEYLSEFMASIYPLLWLSRRILRPRTGMPAEEIVRRDLAVNPVLNAVLTSWLSLEKNLVLRKRRMPCGTSLIALARK